MSIKDNLRVALTTLPSEIFNFKVLSSQPDLPFEVIPKLIDKSWDWCELSNNPNLTIEDVVRAVSGNWNWYILSQKFSITDILKHSDLPWDNGLVGQKIKLANLTLIVKCGDTEIKLGSDFLGRFAGPEETLDTAGDYYDSVVKRLLL